jgi:hypothetical protein
MLAMGTPPPIALQLLQTVDGARVWLPRALRGCPTVVTLRITWLPLRVPRWRTG